MAEEDEKELWWHDIPHYATVVEVLRRDMLLKLQNDLDNQTPCFGHLWKDEDGSCPLAQDCALADFCERAWKMVQVKRARNAKPPPPPRPPQNPYQGSVLQQPRTRLLVDKTRRGRRNKNADSDKSSRFGYADLGRPVDGIVSAFVAAVGNPPQMPLIWSRKNFDKKYTRLGDVVISAPKNYHALIHKGRIAIRFWTNAAKHSFVDIAPELLGAVQLMVRSFPPGKNGKPQIEGPEKIPMKSLMKKNPCTHCVVARTPEAAEALARIVREEYSF